MPVEEKMERISDSVVRKQPVSRNSDARSPFGFCFV